MSVRSIVGGGVRLVRREPRVVAVWAVLYLIVAGISSFATRRYMAGLPNLNGQVTVHAPLGFGAPPAFPLGAIGAVALVNLGLVFAMIIGFAAVVRAVAWPADNRFAYLRVGMDELRLVGLAVLLFLMTLAIEIVAVLLILLVGVAAAAIMGRAGGITVGVVIAIALLFAALYAEVRISLAGPMTVIQGRIVIKDAWHATKGHFWTLFGAFLLMGLLYLVVGIVVAAITSPQLLSAYTSFSPQAIQAAAQAQNAQQLGFGYVARMILAAIISIPAAVMVLGAVATAAVELSDVPNTIAAEFE